MSEMPEVIVAACNEINKGSLDSAREIIIENYPFAPLNNAGRKYSEQQKTKIFIRDGFIDRYSGEKQIFPGVLRLLSTLLPTEFPFQKNWKISECHIAYWQLLPTIDHIIPVSRGGNDNEDNWVSTSQLRNSAKANWLLEELDWTLHPPGDFNEWDGMMNWYISYLDKHPEHLENAYLSTWHRVAKLEMSD